MSEIIKRQRFWLIELLANWEGHINSSHLQHYCRLGRQQASKIINSYQDKYPFQLVYDSSVKGFIPSKQFVPHYISDDVAEYLDWMGGQQAFFPRKNERFHLPNTVLKLPVRLVSPVVMRMLVKALRAQARLDINYISVSNPDPLGRIIVPVQFVNTGQRWHLRAWCEKAQAYRDFVLSRFRDTPSYEGPCLTSLPADIAWDTYVTLRVRPDPRLSSEQQAVLIRDYGMTEGELRLTVRAALADYLLQEMQISTKMLDGNPAAQQLILINYKEVQPWLFT